MIQKTHLALGARACAMLGLTIGGALLAASPLKVDAQSVLCRVNRTEGTYRGTCVRDDTAIGELRLDRPSASAPYVWQGTATWVSEIEMRRLVGGGATQLTIDVRPAGALQLGRAWLALSRVHVDTAMLQFAFRPDVSAPPNEVDVAILRRARAYLIDRAHWNRVDTTDMNAAPTKGFTCAPAPRQSMFCALYLASIEVDGGYAHFRPAINAVREAVATASARPYRHPLVDFNNDSTQTLANVQAVLDSALAIVLKERSQRGAGAAGPANALTASADTGAAMTLPGTHVHDFHSTVNGRDYRLFVALPAGYAARTTNRYPVLYLLDGGIALPVAATTYKVSHRGNDNLILVGVGYADTTAKVFTFRQGDYTLPVSPRTDSEHLKQAREGQCCGAAAMNRVFREEIIPLIDRLYRTTDDRGILGHSYGGLFANYILFADPDLFQRYAITSPSLWWDNSAIFEQEAAWAATHTKLEKHVFFSIGSLENATMTYGVNRMAATLRARNYQGLDLTTFELVGAFHSSMTEFSKALDVLYPLKNGIETYGDSGVKAAAGSVAQAYFADYVRRDAVGLGSHLAGDSAFQAVVDGRLLLGRDRYLAFMRDRFSAMRALTLTVDTLRSNVDANRVTMIASYTRTATPHAGRPVTTHGRLILDLGEEPEGWRIVYALDSPFSTAVTTVVRVEANGRDVGGANVAAYGEAGQLATARTDARGIARLPYDWHVSLDGSLEVLAREYAPVMVPLPTRDSITIALKTFVSLDGSVIDRYVGTFASTDQSIVWRLTRQGRKLTIEHVTAGYRRSAVFLSPTALLESDGTEITVTMDSSGRALELRRGATLLTRRGSP